jgi:mono/diheme cytochrome c family protein
LATPELPIKVRRETLAAAASTPAEQAKLLMLLTKIQEFEPDRTAKAIAPLLLELPSEALLAIDADLDKLLDSPTASLRSAAVALKVQAGAPLGALAERDPAALLEAVSSLTPEQAPDTLPAALIDLAESGQLDAGIAIQQADRLSAEKASLFTRLAGLAEPAMQVTYDQWGESHALAMAALAGMHQTPEDQWPEGFDAYKIGRADDATMAFGKDIYFAHDQGCYKCHGQRGEGTSGFPPLAYSPTLVGDPVRAANILKYGLQGELPHTINPADGMPFNAQMEPLSQFDDAEMAAVLTYVRQSFGNFASPVTIQHMQAARAPQADKGEGENMWQAAALFEKYPFTRDRLVGSLPPPAVSLQKWNPPSIGLWLMLAVVGVSMLLILAATYAGKFLQDPSGVQSMHSPAH